MPRSRTTTPPATDLLSSVPETRRQEILSDALGSELRAVFSGHFAAQFEAIKRMLTNHPFWTYFQKLPISTLMEASRKIGPAKAPARATSAAPEAPAAATPTTIESGARFPAAAQRKKAAGISQKSAAAAQKPARAATKSQIVSKKPAVTPKKTSAVPKKTGIEPKTAAKASQTGESGDLLELIATHPGIRVGDLLTLAGGDKERTKARLTELRNSGKVKFEGKKRGMSYRVA